MNTPRQVGVLPLRLMSFNVCSIFYCNSDCEKKSLVLDYIIVTSLAGSCFIVSLWNIGKHLKYFTNPHFQAKIILILCMAPFYCATSLTSIYFVAYEPYLTVIRNIYEAFLLFTFFYLMEAYLAYDQDTQQLIPSRVYKALIDSESEVHHIWPFNYCGRNYKLSSMGKAKYFTYRCKKYVLQCFVIKPICAILFVVFTPFQKRYPEFYDWLIFVIDWVLCISVSYSLYYLILFYYALRKPLAPYSPLAKFLVVKITLFFTFWQEIVLSSVEAQLFQCFDNTSPYYSESQITSSISNTLVCLEMLLMSIVGGKAFSFHEFKLGFVNRGKFRDALYNNWQCFTNDFRLIKPKKFGFNKEKPQFKTIEMQYLPRKSVLEAQTIGVLQDGERERGKDDDLTQRLIYDQF